jgi:hypothetical protein
MMFLPMKACDVVYKNSSLVCHLEIQNVASSSFQFEL